MLLICWVWTGCRLRNRAQPRPKTCRATDTCHFTQHFQSIGEISRPSPAPLAKSAPALQEGLRKMAEWLKAHLGKRVCGRKWLIPLSPPYASKVLIVQRFRSRLSSGPYSAHTSDRTESYCVASSVSQPCDLPLAKLPQPCDGRVLRLAWVAQFDDVSAPRHNARPARRPPFRPYAAASVDAAPAKCRGGRESELVTSVPNCALSPLPETTCRPTQRSSLGGSRDQPILQRVRALQVPPIAIRRDRETSDFVSGLQFEFGKPACVARDRLRVLEPVTVSL